MSGADELNDLSDVTLTGAAQNDFLVKSATDFVNQTPAQVRATLDLEVGTDVQGYDATLNSLAGLANPGADSFVQVDSSGNASYVLSSSVGGGLQDVVDDSTPELGGNLDVLTRIITTSTANGSIGLEPDGTGSVVARGTGAGLTPGTVTFNCEENSHGVALQSPPHSASASYTLKLPTSVGTAGRALVTDGNNPAQLSWGGARPTAAVASNGHDLVEFATNFFAAGSSVAYVDIPSSPSDGDEFDLYFHDNQSIDLHMAAGTVNLYVRGIAHVMSTQASGDGYTLHAKRGDYYRIKIYSGAAYLYSLSADRLASTTLLANGASYPADAFTIGEVDGSNPNDPLGVIDYMEGHRTYVVNAISAFDQGAGNFTITLPTPNDAGSTQGASGQARFGFMVTIKRVGDLDVVVVPAAGTTIDADNTITSITLTSDNDSITLMAVGPNPNQWYVVNKDIASTGGGGSFPSVDTTINSSQTLSNPQAGVLEEIYIVDTGSAVTLTLPAQANVSSGFKYNIKRNGNNNLTIAVASGEYIEGTLNGTEVLSVDKASFTLVTDGSGNWYII